MTKKMKLNLKGLKVKSFITGTDPKMLKGGTHLSCNTCNPCTETHQATCEASCNGTCGGATCGCTDTCRIQCGPGTRTCPS